MATGRYYYAGIDPRRYLATIPLAATYGSPNPNLDGPLNDYCDVDGGFYRNTAAGYIQSDANDPPCAYVHKPAVTAIDGSVQELIFEMGESNDSPGLVSRIGATSGGNSPRVGARIFGLFNRLYIFRRPNGTGSDTLMNFIAFSPSLNTRYRMFLKTSPTAAGSTTLVAWVTTDADPTTVLATVTDSTNVAELQTARSCGFITGNTNGATKFAGKIHRHRFALHDAAYSAISYAEPADTGMSLECVPLFGTGPYTFQWKRSTDPNGTFSNVTGATTALFTDTTISRLIPYWWECVVTDTGNANATYTTEPLSGTWLGAGIKLSWFGDSYFAREIVQSGNGRLGTIPDIASRFLWRKMGRKVTSHNAGHSGFRASQFIATDLDTAITDAIANGSTHVLVSFGPNDCQDRSVEQFQADMATICNRILSNGMRPIIVPAPCFHTTDGSGDTGVGLSGRNATMLSTLLAMNNALDQQSGGPVDDSRVLRVCADRFARSSNERINYADDLHEAYGASVADAEDIASDLATILRQGPQGSLRRRFGRLG